MTLENCFFTGSFLHHTEGMVIWPIVGLLRQIPRNPELTESALIWTNLYEIQVEAECTDAGQNEKQIF